MNCVAAGLQTLPDDLKYAGECWKRLPCEHNVSSTWVRLGVAGSVHNIRGGFNAETTNAPGRLEIRRRLLQRLPCQQ